MFFHEIHFLCKLSSNKAKNKINREYKRNNNLILLLTEILIVNIKLNSVAIYILQSTMTDKLTVPFILELF